MISRTVVAAAVFDKSSSGARMDIVGPLGRSTGRQCRAAGRPLRQCMGISSSPVWRDVQTQAPARPATATLSSRWLSDTKQRIGKCIMFGLKPHQTAQAGSILEEIARDWRELLAGSEGYLTGSDRRGLYRQAVVWGEMDSMVSQIRPPLKQHFLKEHYRAKS